MAATPELRTEMVMRHPADATLGRARERRFGRLAKVRRAVVPEDGEAGVDITGARVVNMQPATVAHLEIGLVYHRATSMPASNAINSP
jgi:hypothetical protein